MENQQEKPSSKGVWAILIIIVAAIAIVVWNLGSIDNADEIAKVMQEEKNKREGLENQISNATETQETLVAYRELESYVKSGQTWKNIVVPVGTIEKDLISLAKDIHKKDASGRYHIFDDDAKFQEYKNWDINYGKVKDRDGKAKQIDQCLDIAYCRTLIQQEKYAFPFPEAWGNKHEIAMINEMIDLKTRTVKWQLTSPLGEKISDL